MNFIYPRIISIRRPNPQTGVGAIGYGGVTTAAETVILTGLPASIQALTGKRGELDLPAAAYSQSQWKIFLPRNAAGLGSILSRDIVVDDAGERYQIFASYWNSLGFQLRALLLEA